ncbi:MliC family protein [Thauera sp. CAU 1555]|uniref:MliC family protein n=1 Tax=Thauera sedimentorum TaxID=2767595 RepID=A0ABR9B9C5_9RHOO|nr:MliC family protein [Thauera sedimentorum]MBC9071211.1 MliC family protein [Thauera sedimentorum]MBD8502130.1 MliC family protein [Thauera sedimentorum]
MRKLALFVVLGIAVFAPVASSAPMGLQPCGDAWYRSVEAQLPTGDGQGHGPDVGSAEWKSVVEFRLGVRGEVGIPPRDDEAWCRFVEARLQQRGPSFDCGGVAAGSVEAMICGDGELSAFDRELSGVYAAASRKAVKEHPPRLKAEQRGWIKGRDDCWKSEDRRACVRDAYRLRIAALQASYRLVPEIGPVHYMCDGNPANEVVVTFFHTEPATLIAERGDSVSLMYAAPSASGARYLGRNESFWEHQGEARVTWGYGAQEMRCEKAK